LDSTTLIYVFVLIVLLTSKNVTRLEV
jgi:hypothetical protein